MQEYETLIEVPLKEIISRLVAGEESFEFKGFFIPLSSVRLRTFTKGVSCVGCNKVANLALLQRHLKGGEKSTGHINLYHKGKGGLLLMTSDHIIAKSKYREYNGNINSLENRQPMCATCNNQKGSFNSVEEARQHKGFLETPASKLIKREAKLLQVKATLAVSEANLKSAKDIAKWQDVKEKAEKALIKVERSISVLRIMVKT